MIRLLLSSVYLCQFNQEYMDIGVPTWHSWLRIWRCPGVGSVCGFDPLAWELPHAIGIAKKKKKKEEEEEYVDTPSVSKSHKGEEEPWRSCLFILFSLFSLWEGLFSATRRASPTTIPPGLPLSRSSTTFILSIFIIVLDPKHHLMLWVTLLF